MRGDCRRPEGLRSSQANRFHSARAWSARQVSSLTNRSLQESPVREWYVLVRFTPKSAILAERQECRRPNRARCQYNREPLCPRAGVVYTDGDENRAPHCDRP